LEYESPEQPLANIAPRRIVKGSLHRHHDGDQVATFIRRDGAQGVGIAPRFLRP
jgi:hypothetical protein